jgi:hypothetical protein
VSESIYLNPELTADGIAARLDSLLNDLYFYRPNAVMFVGTIPKAAKTQYLHRARSGEVDALFPGIIAAQAAAGRSVYLVDLRARLSPADIIDRLHPSPEGYAKLGYAWFDAIESVFPPPPRPPHDAVAGDWNLDGHCNYLDWWIFESHWLTVVEPLHDGNLTGDGFVDMEGFLLFRSAFVAGGGSASALSPVPEPTALTLAAMACMFGLAIAVRRKHNRVASH